MTRPRYLPTPAIEILRREIPGLPWESPSGADVSTAEGWISSVNEAVAQTPGPFPLRCTRQDNGWWKMEHGERWGGGRSVVEALDNCLGRITHSGQLEVPDIWPDFWPPVAVAATVGVALLLTALVPPTDASPQGTFTRAMIGLAILGPLAAWLAIRTLRSVAARRARRALAIAEVMRRPLPWLVAAKGPQADAGSLSLTP